MSLWVNLYLGEREVTCSECGHVRVERNCVFTENITHNLSNMAVAAGFYDVVWMGAEKARDIVPALKAGIEKMKADPAYFKTFDAPNGWGMYEGFLPWCEAYLAACEAHPEATVEVSR